MMFYINTHAERNFGCMYRSTILKENGEHQMTAMFAPMQKGVFLLKIEIAVSCKYVDVAVETSLEYRLS